MPLPQSLSVNPQCTFRHTLKNYQMQEWATCYDCFQNETTGACLSCLLKCHRGHRIGPLRQSNFFCDCGANRLCSRANLLGPSLSISGPQNVQHISSLQPYYPGNPVQSHSQSGHPHSSHPQPSHPPPPIFKSIRGQPMLHLQQNWPEEDYSEGTGKSYFPVCDQKRYVSTEEPGEKFDFPTASENLPYQIKKQITPKSGLKTKTKLEGSEILLPPINQKKPLPETLFTQFEPIQQMVGRTTTPLTTTSPTGAIARLNHHFNWKLISQLHPTNLATRGGIYSPFSITYALLMTYLAVRGETRAELHETMSLGDLTPEVISTGLRHLYLDGLKRTDLPLRVANGMFYDYKTLIKPKYLTFMQGLGKVEKCNFRSNPDGERSRINRWVSQITNRMIPNLLDGNSITRETGLVLVNAIYFKADWQYAFAKKSTRPETFYGGITDRVDLMHLPEGKSLVYVEDPLYQVVELPYKQNQYVFGVILPKNRSLTRPPPPSPSQLTKYWQYLQNQDCIEVYLPKFRSDSSYQLIPLLRKLGTQSIFDPFKADFGNLVTKGANQFYVSDIIHQAVIMVDEEGTEAAAATAIVQTFGNAVPTKKPQKITVRADHPFHYYIRDRQRNQLLFMGFYRGN